MRRALPFDLMRELYIKLKIGSIFNKISKTVIPAYDFASALALSKSECLWCGGSLLSGIIFSDL
jgi:hypothetical protein